MTGLAYRAGSRQARHHLRRRCPWDQQATLDWWCAPISLCRRCLQLLTPLPLAGQDDMANSGAQARPRSDKEVSATISQRTTQTSLS